MSFINIAKSKRCMETLERFHKRNPSVAQNKSEGHPGTNYGYREIHILNGPRYQKSKVNHSAKRKNNLTN